MERLRSFKVTVEIDTTNRTEQRTFELDEFTSSTDEVMTAAHQWVDDVFESID